LINLDDPLIHGYLLRLIGEDGITLIRNMPEGEVTDEEICSALNPLRAISKAADDRVKKLNIEIKATKEKGEETKKLEKELAAAEKEAAAAKGNIADEKEITLNTVRKILFILYENKFTICHRERDANSGWLTFRWLINMDGIYHQIEREKKKLYRNLVKRKEYEDNNIFYVCPQNCLRLVFDESTETEFLCPLCGEDLVFQDNEPFKELLDQRIEEFEKVV
jgi:transcription initiation factor TFIIE subunit alpha